MTLDEFIKTTHREVDEFKMFYLKSAKAGAKKGEDWPLKNNEGEWYEQFIAWQQMRNKQ